MTTTELKQRIAATLDRIELLALLRDCLKHNGGLTTVDRMKAFADTRLAEVQTKIEAEILDTEGAMIYATDQGEWNRRAVLEGHKSGLLWVSNRIKEMLNES